MDKMKKMMPFILSGVIVLLCVIILFFYQKDDALWVTFFDGKIIENNSSQILVEGLGSNQEYFRGEHEVTHSNDIKYVDKDGNEVFFSDLQAGKYVRVKLVNKKSEFKKMKNIQFVLKVTVSDTQEGLYENIEKGN